MSPARTATWMLAIVTLCSSLAGTVAAQEWTRFRGPNGTGISEADGIPTAWNDSQYLWRTELPGAGHAAPVIWGDRVFTISASEDGAKRYVICLNRNDGSRLWQREFDSTPHPKHALNSFASATPAVDEMHVYVAWSAPESYALRAFDHEGNEVWARDLGAFESQHSCGTSPIVYKDMMIINNDQDGPSYLLACDRRNGDIRWQTPRTTDVVSYATPCVMQRKGSPPEMLFNSGAHGISSLDPLTGRKNWELDVFDKRTVSSPVVVMGDLVIGTCGSGAGGNYVAAVRPGGIDGAAPQPEEVFRLDKAAPYCPTPLACGDLLFLWSDKGVVSCVECPSGEMLWQQRVGGNYYGSPICIKDHLYCVSDQGEAVVLEAGREFKELGRTNLGEGSHSTPAVANGCLYLRTFSHLLCVGPVRQP